ncbi:MAG: phosphopentomutase [Bacilli bacterium]|nr:phosphopentomutase [Bacilli bacterium]
MKFKRIFLVVLDSLGVGEALDSENYGDKGANTLGNIVNKYELFIPNLKKLGFLNTLTMNNLESDAYYTIARPKNKGKDSISGHYELMGIENNVSYKTFSDNGFPRELLEEIVKETKKGIIGNLVGNHSDVIKKLGSRHMETGALVIYTTGDSDLEIAACEEKIPINELYNYAEIIRKITEREEWKVARVVARPFTIQNDEFYFTNNTRYFTLTPPNRSVLDILKEHELQVISIGKIHDIYNGYGITKIIKSTNNSEGLSKLYNIIDKNFDGLCYTNLSDFDTLYGHKRDAKGYAKAIEELDVEIPLLLNKLNIDDLLIITADHGCDPTLPRTNHTRENVPVIIYSRLFKSPHQLDVLESFSDIGATILENFEIEEKPWMGNSFLDKLK